MREYFYNERFWTWPIESIGDVVSYTWLVLFALMLLLRRWRRREHRALLVFVGYSLFMEYFSNIHPVTDLFSEKTNYSYYHVMTPLLGAAMINLFAPYVFRRRWVRWAVPVAFAVFCLINGLWIEDFEMFPKWSVGAYSLLGIGLSLLFFGRMLTEPPVFYPEREPMFWIATGALIYYSVSLLLWFGFNYLTYDRELFYDIYRINGYNTLLFHLMLLTCILLRPTPDAASPLTPLPV